jgi:hypothetical protein
MVLSVGCTLADDVPSPTAKFTLKIVENSDLCQQLVDEGIRVIPGVPIGERTATSKGNYVWQLKKGGCRDLHPPIDRPVSRPHHPGAPLGRLRGPARPMDVRAGSDAYIGGQWDPLDPTDGIAPNRIALVARGRARPRPHPRRFSTRLKRTPSRFRVCWRDRGRVRICRRADGFGFGLGPFLPIFCCQLLK